MEILKIRTKIGRIITLRVDKKTDSSYIGTDKYGEETIVSKDDIDSLFTLKNGDNNDY